VSSSCGVLGAKISSFSHSKIFLLMVVGLVVCGELLLVCGGDSSQQHNNKTRKNKKTRV